MSRTGQRWSAFARAALRRWLHRAWHILTVDPGKEPPTDAAAVAEAETLARSAGDLKGGMAKLAQLMAYLEGPGGAADAQARRVLGTLWDAAPGVDRAAIRRVVTEDLGAPPEERFATWDDAPLAAASLGEVHAATALDGAALAVKVQYPGVAEALRADLASGVILRRLAGAEVGGSLSREAAEALRESLLLELDYVTEAKRLDEFRAAFAGDPAITIPRPYPALSSTRVLAMERLPGRALTAFAASAPDAARAAVAATILRFAWASPLRHGLFNADPNPGNYLVDEGDDGQVRVGFLDFGCAPRLSPDLVEIERRLWRAVLKHDGETLRHAVHEEGLLGPAITLDSTTYRLWERHLAAPFLDDKPFLWTAEHARELVRLTSLLVQGGGLKLPPGVLLLWRQRLGVASVLGSLRPRADFRAALRRSLDG